MGKSKSQAAADGKHNALYLRVSGRGQDTASQEPDLKRWADSQDLPVVWYRDKFTGKTMDRPGWNKLAKDIEAGKVRTAGLLAPRPIGTNRQGTDSASLRIWLSARSTWSVSRMGWTSRPPPAASWRTFSPLWPPMRPKFVPSASARAGSGPGRRQAPGKARRNPNPRQGDSGARHPGSTDEDRGGTDRQHCPGNRTVSSHDLSGSRSTRRGCEVRPGRRAGPVEARAPRPRPPPRSPPG